MFRRSANERTISFEHTLPSLYPSSSSTSSSCQSSSSSRSEGLLKKLFRPHSGKPFSSASPNPFEEVELFLHVSPGGLLGRWLGRCLRLRVGRFQCVVRDDDGGGGGGVGAKPGSVQETVRTTTSNSTGGSSTAGSPLLGVRVVEVETDSILPDMEVVPPPTSWRRKYVQEESNSNSVPPSPPPRPLGARNSCTSPWNPFSSSLLPPPVFSPRVPLTLSERNKIVKRLFSSDVLDVDRFPLAWFDVEEETAQRINGELYVKGIPQRVQCRKFSYPRLGGPPPPPATSAAAPPSSLPPQRGNTSSPTADDSREDNAATPPPAVSAASTTSSISSSSSSSFSRRNTTTTITPHSVAASPLQELQAIQAAQRDMERRERIDDEFLHIYCSIPDITAFAITKPSLWMGLFSINATVEVEAKVPLTLLP